MSIGVQDKPLRRDRASTCYFPWVVFLITYLSKLLGTVYQGIGHGSVPINIVAIAALNVLVGVRQGGTLQDQRHDQRQQIDRDAAGIIIDGAYEKEKTSETCLQSMHSVQISQGQFRWSSPPVLVDRDNLLKKKPQAKREFESPSDPGVIPCLRCKREHAECKFHPTRRGGNYGNGYTALYARQSRETGQLPTESANDASRNATSEATEEREPAS
jgi:hypothetical protein